ncbi:DUF1214 domain-containing protein [Aquabacter sp. CN5-332]|uniref:DUF1214 domain-containing protein n=1 Tax=Aquabacter sp. CN5-332 TaxID=3156608 RepID=UPI0032B51A44
MPFTRRMMLALLASAAMAPMLPRTLRAQAKAGRPDDAALTEAYVYLLGRMLVIRQERKDAGAAGFAYNAIKYNPLGSADFVNPNFDVAYLEAWLAADDDAAVLLEVPKIEGRYYTAQILDEWGEVIANINERTFPSKPHGAFALVKPGTNPPIPAGAGRIELHSAKAKLLGRVELKGDPEGAVALQKAFTAKPLGKIDVAAPPAIPDFDNATLLGAEIFDHVDAAFASALDVSPVAAPMQQKVRAIADYVASGPEARADVDRRLKEKIVPQFIEDALTKSAPYRNHWLVGGQGGNYGSDVGMRTVANYAGIWANSPEEVVYFVASRDAQDKPLNGGQSYVIHFPANALPDSVVDAYWSVILVGMPDYRVMPNPLNRFNLNNQSKLEKEADGALKIGIGPKPVAGVPEANWLPSTPSRPFSLTFRTYVPKDMVRNGQWTPPAVTVVQ